VRGWRRDVFAEALEESLGLGLRALADGASAVSDELEPLWLGTVIANASLCVLGVLVRSGTACGSKIE